MLKKASHILKGFFFDEVKEPVKKPRKGSSKRLPAYLKRGRPMPKVAIPTDFEAIEIDYSEFPKGSFKKRPHHRQWDKVKIEKIDQVFDVIYPYYKYIISMKGMMDNEPLQRAVEHIIRRYILHFWDLPSSKNHHHSVPFGGLVHSMEVACIEADWFLKQKTYQEYGVDTEMTRKTAMWKVFAGFLVGMFHDVNKIHDVDIYSVGENREVFDPTPGEGELLLFKMKHPEGVKVDWKDGKKRRKGKTAYNVMYVWTLAAPKPLRQMGELYWDAMDKLNSYEGLESDKLSVSRWAGGGDFADQVLREVGRWYLQASDVFRQNEAGLLHKIDPNWYACDSKKFLGQLAQRIGHVPLDFVKAMGQSNLMVQQGNSYFLKVKMHLPGGIVKKKPICFVRADLIDQAISGTTTDGDDKSKISQVSGIGIDFQHKPEVLDLFRDTSPVPESYVFINPAEKEDEEKKKKKKDAKKPEKKAEKKGGKKPKEKAPAAPKKKPKRKPAAPALKIDDFTPKNLLEVKDETVAEEPTTTEESVKGAPEVEVRADEPPATEEVNVQVEDTSVPAESELESNPESEGAIEPDSSVAFYESNDNVTAQQAQDLLVDFVRRVAKREKYFQQKNGGIIFLTDKKDLLFHYPICFHEMLGIPPRKKIQPEAKVLRSKLMKHLRDAGYITEEGGKAYSERRFEAVSCSNDIVDAFTVSGNYSLMDFTKLFSLDERFGERLGDMFADINHAEEISRDAGEASNGTED